MLHAITPITLAALLACSGCSSEAPNVPAPAADAGRDAQAVTDAQVAADGQQDAAPDARAIDMRPQTSADRYATSVSSFTPGACAGFGAAGFPRVVLGPPEGGGAASGSLDVLSLGSGGSIVLSFAANPIIDGVGDDFVVFENAFNLGDDPKSPFAELAEVSVSDDGSTWRTFACEATSFPFGSCAGWRPVYSASNTSISALDSPACGGDPFDLAALGLARAKFVRIRDLGKQACPAGAAQTTNGFDLDGIASLHSERP